MDAFDCGEFCEEALGGTEEQGAVEPVGEDVFTEQRVFLGARDAIGPVCDRFGDGAGVACNGSEREERSDSDADLDRDDEVERDGGCRGEYEYGGVAACARRTMRTPWTSTMRTAVTMSTPASAASGMRATSAPPRYATARSSNAWVIDARRVRPPERTFTAVRAMAPVAGIPPKRGAIRFARPWPNSSRSGLWASVSLMPSATLAESRLSRPARSAIANAADTSSPSWSPPRLGSAGRGKAGGQIADAWCGHPSEPGEDRRENHREKRSRDRAMQASRADHDDGHEPDEQQRSPVALAAERRADRAHRDRRGVLTGRFGNAERGGDLLEEDDDRDTDGEALDNRPGDVGKEATDARKRGGDHHHACENPDDRDRARTEARHHRNQDDGHRAGRSRYLHVGTAEHGSDEPGDDRGHQPGLGAETGRDPESEREWQRDDTDGDAGDEVTAPRVAHSRIVGAPEHRPSPAGDDVSSGGRPPPGVAAAPARRSRRVERFAHEAPAAFRPARSSVDSLNDTNRNCFATASSSASSGARSE